MKQAGVVHNITSQTVNQLKLLYPYCACHTKKEMHSRDTTILIDFLWFIFVHCSGQYFFSIYYGSWKFLIF